MFPWENLFFAKKINNIPKDRFLQTLFMLDYYLALCVWLHHKIISYVKLICKWSEATKLL